MPLLPRELMRHSQPSSKLSKVLSVMMSPPCSPPTFFKMPSSTFQPLAGIVFMPYPRHPLNVFPSNSNLHLSESAFAAAPFNEKQPDSRAGSVREKMSLVRMSISRLFQEL